MGVLYAKTGPGNTQADWTPVGGGGGVFVGPNDPGGTYELWYDNDAPSPPRSSIAIPIYTNTADLRADTQNNLALILMPMTNVGFQVATRNPTGTAWQVTYTAQMAARTTDAAGYIYWTAAELGFTTLTAVLGSINWSVNSPWPSLSQSRVSANQVNMRVWNLSGNVASGGTLGYAANQSIALTWLTVTGII